MDDRNEFAPLLKKSLLALAACSAIVAACYFFVDRPVAFFVHDRGLPRYTLLKWLTYPPPIAQAWAPAALALLAVRRAWGPLWRWQRALLAACVGIIVADQFRESLSYVFGRDWPETWTGDNPSLIQNDAYGFHPFGGSLAFGSFPSGHAARTAAVAAIVWLAYPQARALCIAVSVAIALGLVGMNYHFIGDVVAGSFVGAVVGIYTAYFCGLGNAQQARSIGQSRHSYEG